MSTYLTATLDVNFKDKNSKEMKKAIIDNGFLSEYAYFDSKKAEPTEDTPIDEILSGLFDVAEAEDGSYSCEFSDECGYSFASSLEDFFRFLTDNGFLNDGSALFEESDDDGGWKAYWHVKNGTVIAGHDVAVTVFDDELATGDEVLKALKLAVAELESMAPEEREQTAASLKDRYAAQGFFNKLMQKVNAA